jgi:hypothetical protein
VCRFHIAAAGAKQILDEVPYKLSRAVAKLAGITFWHLAFSCWFDKPRFLTEGKLATVLIIPSSWGSQLGGYLPTSPHPSGYFCLLILYEFLGISLELLIFRNMVSWRFFFQQNPDSGSKSSNDHQTCKNRGNNISIISKYEIYQWITVNYDIK